MTLAIKWRYFFYFLFVRTQRVWYKTLWNWHVNDFWPFDLAPRSPGWPQDENVTCILFCLSSPSIWYATWSCLKKNWPPWAPPSAPKSPPGAWPRLRNKKNVWYVLYLSFVWRHTKFGIKIFVIEIKWYLTFWPLPRAPGGGAKENLRCVPQSCE